MISVLLVNKFQSLLYADSITVPFSFGLRLLRFGIVGQILLEKKHQTKRFFLALPSSFAPPPTRLQFCLYVVLFCVNILYRPPRGTRLDLSLLPQIVDLLKFKVEMGSVKIQLPKDLTVRVTHVEVLPNRGTLICDTVSNACNEGEKLLAFI